MNHDANQSCEQQFLASPKNAFAIYQLKPDLSREYGFESLSRLTARGLSVEYSNYNCIHSVTLDKDVGNINQFLNRVFDHYNLYRPDDFKGHSVSVGDVIAVKVGTRITTHYVDDLGFTRIPKFLSDSQAVRTAPATIETLTEQLCIRMHSEYDAFLDELKNLSSEDVIERAYEKVLKEDLIVAVETGTFSKKQLEGLLSLESPLATAYGEWLSNDFGHMEMLRDTIETLADAEARHLQPKKKQHER